MFGFLRSFFREVGQRLRGAFETGVRGLIGMVGPRTPVTEPLAERYLIREAAEGMSVLRQYMPQLEFSHTTWIYERVAPGEISQILLKNQMYSADVTLVGPDGQVVTIYGLVMPTGKRVVDVEFNRRLAAELKRLEEEGKINPLGMGASSYVERSLVHTEWYRVTIKPKGV